MPFDVILNFVTTFELILLLNYVTSMLVRNKQFTDICITTYLHLKVSRI